jgi:GMP synthase-like glutamine amidotransferase
MTDVLSKNGSVDAFILEADGTVDADHGYGYLIAKRLADFNVKTQLISLEKEADKLTQLPKKPLFISGGMTEVTAEVDWVVEVRSFLRETIHKNQQADPSDQHAIFGICFGAQIIAESYRKGSVVYLEDPEIGETQVTVDDPHPLFQGFEKTFPAYTFHYNQIKPHKDFSLIAQNHYKGHTFTQAFEIPKASCFGVQFHPEFGYEEFQTLVKTYAGLLRSLHQNPEEILKSLPEIPHNAGLLHNFFQFYSKQEA